MYWTAEILVRYILRRACVWSGQFSQLPLIQYMELCIFSLPWSPKIIMIPVLDFIIIIESELWPICHCLGLGHEKK